MRARLLELCSPEGHGWIAALLLFNAIDSLSTYLALKTGHFQEANPVIAFLISISPALAFVGVKLVLVSSLALWAYIRARRHNLLLIRLTLRMVASSYGIVLATHVAGWIRYFSF